jgi:quinol monooxygenase YgiN
MSYIVVRLYASVGEVNVEQLSQRAGRELAPQLFKAGCQRYTTVKFADGRIGSTALYKDEAAAERGAQIGGEWAISTGAVQGSGPARTLRGEHVFSHHPQLNPSLANTFGVIRVYRSTASAQDVKEALEQEATPILRNAPGLLRYTVFKTDGDQGYVVMTANTSPEAASQLTAQARAAVTRTGSMLQRVFPVPPEVIEGDIIHSYTN